MGSLSLLQGIFPTQESNRGSPALQADSLPTELSGKPYSVIYKKNNLRNRLAFMLLYVFELFTNVNRSVGYLVYVKRQGGFLL